MWAPAADCGPPTGTDASCSRHTAARLAPNPGPGREACCHRSQSRAPRGVRQQEGTRRRGGRRQGRGLTHPTTSCHSAPMRKPRQADRSPCCHKPKSHLAFLLSASYSRCRALHTDLSQVCHPAGPGTVCEHCLPQFHHLENRANRCLHD